MSSKPITLAICGAGSRGLLSYAPYALKHPDELKVVAVAEPREWFRDEAMKRHKIPAKSVFSDWREMAAKEKLADAVLVATQDSLHKEPAIAFIKKNYDVLLEKPMACNETDCREIAEAARGRKSIFALCHVLRYTPYFRRMKAIVESGVLGQIATVRHIEPVGFWHQAHSYVRGNWRNEKLSSPMILSKSCHDMDILLFILGKKCLRISSFGSLMHFRKENKPKNAEARCLDCPLADNKCPYSAKAFYMKMVNDGNFGWPLSVICTEMTPVGVEKALRKGPYGRCVYSCDNDVVDHQIVSMLFENETTASFTMTAFTPKMHRETDIFGSLGCLRGDGNIIKVTNFLTGRTDEFDVNRESGDITGGHGGGDEGLMKDFVKAVRARDFSLLSSGPEVSLESHMMAFAAERSRRNNTVERIEL
ncbi:MAG TPA: oxidoreductase [Lentisphaeria bacterium]|nr:MAG: oxidoreductase [Lentisphaerae bacterium GWF2_49_21]HBC87068.1 oxidoreductase [Lentisphaeria bacterium]